MTVIAESKRPNIMSVTSEPVVEMVDKPEEDRSSVDDDGDDYGTSECAVPRSACAVPLFWIWERGQTGLLDLRM